jgi:hypothetical protein
MDTFRAKFYEAFVWNIAGLSKLLPPISWAWAWGRE